MYQFTVIAGNVGRDPETRTIPGGNTVTDFSVAVNRKWTGQDGQKHEKTTWFRVSAWGKLAEICGQYVKKGMGVLVTGEVDASAWIDNNEGKARSQLELTARDVKFLTYADNAPQHENPARPGDSDYGGGGYGSSDLQDIPF